MTIRSLCLLLLTTAAATPVLAQQQPLVVNTPPLGDATRGVHYNAALSATGGSGTYSWSLFSGTLPMGLSVSGGAITGTPTDTAGVYNFAVQVTDTSDPPNVAFGRLTLTLRNAAITLAPSLLPAGIIGGVYTSGVTASGGTGGPYTYSWTGTTPPPLSLNASTGAITGTPTGTGTFNFTINVSDGSQYTPTFPGQGYSITIFPVISIAPLSIPNADALVNYSQTFTASGGSGSGYSYSISITPPGMSFTGATGLLSGPPSPGGPYNFTITAHDSLGFSGFQNYTLTVNPVLSLSPSTLNAGQVGTVYTQIFTASGGAGGYSYTFTGTSVPGLNFNAGTLTGSPTTGGAYNFTITARDSLGGSAAVNYTLTINNQAITLAPASLPSGIVNGNYSQTFVASGGNGGPYTYSINGSTPGLTLNTSTGVLSGAPTSNTTYSFTIGVSDGSQFTPAFQPKSYTINVLPGITISPTSIPSGDPGVNYSQTFTASGGSGSGYSYSISTLPPGLSFNSSTGVLSGPPSPGGTTSFTITAHDSAGFSGTSGTITLTVNSSVTMTPASLNAVQTGVVYSQTFTASGGSGSGYTYTFNGTAIAGLNFSAGTLSGTPTTAGSYPFSITAKDSLGGSATNNYTLTINNPAITLAPASLPAGIVNGNYSQTLVATGGNGGPYTYSITGSTPGLTLNTATGQLSGAPTSSTTYNFTIGVSDGSQFTPAFTPKGYTITVFPVITISPAVIPSADLLLNYSQTFTASGGSGSGYSYSISATPAGLGLNASTGTLSGPPSSSGAFNFTITARDSAGFTGTSGTITLNVNPALTLSPGSLTSAQVGTGYSQAFTASGGSGGYTYSLVGTAPPGLGLNANVLSGTPTSSGTFSFSISARDSLGGTVTNPYSLTIANPPIVVQPTAISNGQVGVSYSQVFTASGGNNGPYTFSISQANLFGLTFNAGAATLSGTPTSSGTSSITISAADGQLTGQRTYTLTVNPAGLTLSPSTIANGIVGVKYTQAFTAGGGSGNYTFTLTPPNPSGLAFSASGATATLSGTPTTFGSFPLTLQVNDGTSTFSRNYTLAISASSLSILTTSLPGATQGLGYSTSLSATGGSPPYTWAITSGGLPGGLTLTASGPGSGLITGAPNAAGGFTFGVTVTDSLGATATTSLSIVVQASSLMFTTTSPLPPALSGAAYSVTFGATGGVPPYSISINPGTTGLTVSGATLSGKIINASATPVTYNVSAKVSDSAQNSISGNFTLTVQPAAAGLILSAGSLAFTAVSNGASPLPQYVSVSSTTQASVAFSVASDSSWLSATPGGGNTPATLQINVNQAGLKAGMYSGNITVTGPDGQHGVSVSLKVIGLPPQVSVAPTIVSFETDGTSQPGAGGIQVSNIGDGTLNISVSVTNGSSWVSLGSFNTMVTATAPASVPVNAVIAGLGPGDYRDVIHIDSDVGGSADVPVTLLVAGGSTINLVPAGALYPSRLGQGVSNGTQSFQILSTGSTPISFNVSLIAGSGWLTLNTTSGTTSSSNPGVVSYSVNPSNLAVGDFYARIHIDAPNATNAPVDFVVVSTVAPTSTPADPDPSPAGELFVSSPGSLVPPAQTIQVNTSSIAPIAFSAAANTDTGGNWLSVSPTSGFASSAAPGQVSVTVNAAGLATGVYLGGISFTLQGNPTGVRTVNIVLIVTGSAQSPTLISDARTASEARLKPAAGCSPSKLVALQTGLVSNFQTPAGWPTPLAIQLDNDCGGPVTNASVVATFSNGDAPLALQLSDSKNAVYSATWNPHGAANQVTVSATATASPLQSATAQIVGTVKPNQVPILFQHGTIHNMNPQPGAPLAPGTIVQIYGSGLAPAPLQTSLPLPTNVSGTTVIIGGIEAPLYYVSDGQLNAELPLELVAGRQYQILVSANGALTTPDTLDIEAVTPGVAALANGMVVAQHVDNSYVTAASPAQPGEILTIYLAGMGLTDVPIETGQIGPSSPLAHPTVAPTVTVNGEQAQIDFAGLTPEAVGLYQIDFTVPSDAPAGNLQLVVSQGNVQSNVSTLIVQ